MDPKIDELRRQLVQAHDEIDRLRALLRRVVTEGAECLDSEAAPELLAEIDAAVGPEWRVSPG